MVKESLKLRDKLFKELKENLNIDFRLFYNDLYNVKKGKLRKLSGDLKIFVGESEGIKCRNDKDYYLKKYNEGFDKVKDYIDNNDFGSFKVEIKKKSEWGIIDYECTNCIIFIRNKIINK